MISLVPRYVVASLASLQIMFAFIRPDPGTKLRENLWNPMHRIGGRTTTLLAWATVFTGIAVHHNSRYRAPIVPWVAPIAVALAVVLLADPVLRDLRGWWVEKVALAAVAVGPVSGVTTPRMEAGGPPVGSGLNSAGVSAIAAATATGILIRVEPRREMKSGEHKNVDSAESASSSESSNLPSVQMVVQ